MPVFAFPSDTGSVPLQVDANNGIWRTGDGGAGLRGFRRKVLSGRMPGFRSQKLDHMQIYRPPIRISWK